VRGVVPAYHTRAKVSVSPEKVVREMRVGEEAPPAPVGMVKEK